MDYRPLGRTGVQVSKLCLGTMMFGAWGNTDHDDSIRIIHRALDAGINFVDTADNCSAGESEVIVGKALKGRRDDIVLATKFWGPMGEDPNRRGVSRRWVITGVENSLRRLGTDWIDLYQMHRPDPDTDIDETLAALTDLVQQGKIRYIGSSSFSAGPAAPGSALRHVAAGEPAQARSRRAARGGGRRRGRVADRAGHRLRRPPPRRDLRDRRPAHVEQLDSQLPAADVALDVAILDRIDEIVRPGVNLNPADTSYGEHVLKPAPRRR